VEADKQATETEILHKLLDDYDIRTRPDVDSMVACYLYWEIFHFIYTLIVINIAIYYMEVAVFCFNFCKNTLGIKSDG
jgi:hypothetical protein